VRRFCDPRARVRFAVAALAASLCQVVFVPTAFAQNTTSGASVTGTVADATATAFDIVVRAPETVKALLEQHLELKRYQAVTDLDEAELTRLSTLAASNVRNLVGTLGYFNPEITIKREGKAGEKPSIVVEVAPGELTHTSSVTIDFSGDISTSADADAVAQRQTIKRDWALPPGQRFTQDGWDSAKAQALRQLLARRYPGGRVAKSLADIDAPANAAHLSLALDSGPLYRLGPAKVTGVDRYDPVLVPRLARLNIGDVYDQKKLNDAQLRLTSSGYFDAATVFIDPEGDPGSGPTATPVQIQVREAKLQKVILGVGASTDNGPRASLEYTHLRVPGIGWRATTKLQLDRKSPFAETEWTSLPNPDNWRWVALARAERVQDQQLVTQSERLRFGRTQFGDSIDRNVYLQYDRARVNALGNNTLSNADTGDGSAISGNYVWTGRYFDSLPFPTKGYGWGFELGGGFTLNDKRQPFTRAVARWTGIHSLAERRGRIVTRAEVGAVIAADSARIPSGQLFRTGGDSTVRGYGYRDIGIALPGSAVGPGRFLSVGSVEWQRPILKDGVPSSWEHTIFIDAGAVADNPKDLKPSVGIGTGLRWKSPVGPLQIDLAYGVKVKRLRLHVSVGFVF
jgi:translocation and assembly module TamA